MKSLRLLAILMCWGSISGFSTLGDSQTVGTLVAAHDCESDYFPLTKQGKALFNGRGICFACHGRDADGKTDLDPTVSLLNPKPSDLRNSAALKHLTDEDRYSVIRNGIDGTGMPAFRGALEDREMRLIIEYLQALKTGGC